MNRFTLLILFVFFLLTQVVTAQLSSTAIISEHNLLVDYPEFPQRYVTYTHAKIRYNFDEMKQLLQGTVTYDVAFFRPEVNEIALHAFRMQIHSVMLDSKPAEFRLHNDTLYVQVSEQATSEIKHQMEITFDTDLNYGFFETEGSVWFSSTLPYGIAHFLPGYIHPRNQMTFEIDVTVPAGFEVVAPGVQLQTSFNADSRTIFQFSMEKPISITDMMLAFGKLEHDEVQYGVKKIRLYSIVKTITKQQKTQLVEKAYTVLKTTEKQLNQEYPFSAFSMVVLPDDYWNCKTYGAAMGWIFQSIPNVDAQVERLVYAQWFGVEKQAVNRKTALYDVYWQAWMAATQHNIESAYTLPLVESYQTVNSPYYWNVYANFTNRFSLPENQYSRQTFSKAIANLKATKKNILLENDYLEALYVHSGVVFDSLRAPKAYRTNSQKGQLTIDYDELSRLTVQLKAEYSLQELLDAELVVVTPTKKSTRKFAFTSANEAVTFKVGADVANVYVHIIHSDWEVSTQKPMDFWLYQLRNEQTALEKITAAKALVADTTNPDLQLIINDLLKSEKTPEIRAELLELYAKLTKGATGTEQLFLESFSKGSMHEKKAALHAFSYFPRNPEMISVLQRLIRSKKEEPLQKIAIQTLPKVMSDSTYFTFASDFIRANRSNAAAVWMLTTLENSALQQHKTDLFLDIALNAESGKLRLESLKLVFESKLSNEEQVKLFSLFSDKDPRIRYAMLKFLSRFSAEQIGQILEDRINSEYDFRIVSKLNELASVYLAGN